MYWSWSRIIGQSYVRFWGFFMLTYVMAALVYIIIISVSFLLHRWLVPWWQSPDWGKGESQSVFLTPKHIEHFSEYLLVICAFQFENCLLNSLAFFIINLEALFVRIDIAVMIHHDQQKLGEERVYMAYISWITGHWGKPRQKFKLGGNLEAEADVGAMAECCSSWLAHPAFLQNPAPQAHGGSTHSGLSLLPSITN